MDEENKFWKIAAMVSAVLLVIAVVVIVGRRRKASSQTIPLKPRGLGGLIVANAVPVSGAGDSAAGWWASGYADEFEPPGPVGIIVGNSVGASGSV